MANEENKISLQIPDPMFTAIQGFATKYKFKHRAPAMRYLMDIGMRCALASIRGKQLDIVKEPDEEEARQFQELVTLGREWEPKGDRWTEESRKAAKRKKSARSPATTEKRKGSPPKSSDNKKTGKKKTGKKKVSKKSRKKTTRKPEPALASVPESTPPPIPNIPSEPMGTAARLADELSKAAEKEVKAYLKSFDDHYVAEAFKKLTRRMTALQKLDVANDWGAYTHDQVLDAVASWIAGGRPDALGPQEISVRAQKILDDVVGS